ncbi:MAG: AEC family transporter [Myxococcales bacterium]|jgi:predicted permease
MAELLAFVGVMVASGYILRSTALVRAEMAKDLSTAVFYFTLPPLVFLEIHRAELSWSLLTLPAVAWGVSIFGSIVGLALARAFKLPKVLAGSLVIVTVFGNTTFFGYPVLQGFYGSRGLTLGIFYDLLGASMATNTVAVVLASTAGGDGRVEARQIVRKLLLFPPIWGLALGLALRGVALPELLTEILTRIGNLTTPLIMLSIGLSLQLSAWKKDLKWVAVAAVGKLLVVPLIVFLVLGAIDLSSEILQVSVLQAAMPTMFFSLTLALLFGLRLHLVVNAIMVSTLLSFATLPLWRWLVG